MKILAVEFSSELRSVALVDAPGAPVSDPARIKVLARAEEHGGRHTRALVLIETVLREAGWERESIECIAVGLGPGSYAGIRAAIALAQGWQLARDVRVLGIGSVECFAAQAHAEGARGEVHFLIDAQRNEFYCARAELDASPRVEPLRLIGLDEARALAAGALCVEPTLLNLFPQARPMCPDAATLGRLAAARTEFNSAEKLEPVYLRATSFVKAPPPRVIRGGQAS
jgi:tRNA threonylcarbamoyl adenosine modification protein YeaZ